MGGAPLPRTSVSARKSHCTFFSPEKLARTVTYFSIWIRQWGVRINLTTSILSFSWPPTRKVARERKRAPRAGHLSSRVAIFINGAFTKLTRSKGPVIVYRRGKDLGQNKVKFSRYPLWMLLHWSDPPNNFWWLSQAPLPPPPSSFSKQIWVIPPLNPSEVFRDPSFWVLSYDWSPFCSPKNLAIPPKIPLLHPRE